MNERITELDRGLILNKGRGLFAKWPGGARVAELAGHVAARDWRVHGGPGACAECTGPRWTGPSGGGEARGTRTGWPAGRRGERWRHGCEPEAHRGGGVGHGEASGGYGRDAGSAASAMRARDAAGVGWGERVARRRRRGAPASASA